MPPRLPIHTSPSTPPSPHGNPLSNTHRRQQETTTWPELAIGLYGKLTGRGAEITYEFENMEVWVPSATGSERHAHWKLNGAVRVRTRDDVRR